MLALTSYPPSKLLKREGKNEYMKQSTKDIWETWAVVIVILLPIGLLIQHLIK